MVQKINRSLRLQMYYLTGGGARGGVEYSGAGRVEGERGGSVESRGSEG